MSLENTVLDKTIQVQNHNYHTIPLLFRMNESQVHYNGELDECCQGLWEEG